MLQQLLSAAQRMPTPNLYARLMAYVETLRLRSELWAQSLGAEDSVTRVPSPAAPWHTGTLAVNFLFWIFFVILKF